MDVLNRIKSAVTTVLPVGNPITGDFEILEHKASGGPGMLWKVYDAVQKNTKQPASVFVFEKKLIERYSKHEKDVVIEMMKKGVSQLTRLRHPKVLSVLHPLEDSRESLAFATEPVFISLANVLGQHDNLPPAVLTFLKDYTLFDVEIKYGLLQILECLKFLQESVKMVHGNICPESVFINRTGCWKVAGFEFSTTNSNEGGQAPYYACREWNQRLPPISQPKLNYLAPEYALTKSCDPASDMFSVGVLIYAIYNNGRSVFDAMSQWSTFKEKVDQLRNMRISVLNEVPSEIRDNVKMLINTEPAVRPDPDQLSKNTFFEDVGTMALQYLDMLVQKDNLQKSQFLKGLPNVVTKLPKRVNLRKVIPSLSKECSNNNMIPFVLPTIFVIAEQVSDKEFTQFIFPVLIPLFPVIDPVQVTLIFLQNMNLLLGRSSQNDIKNYILPMIGRALEINTPQIQELCLNTIPTIANLVDYTSLKNSIVARLRKLSASKEVSLSIRVSCLVCLGKLLEHLDKWFVLDEILPLLPQIPSREPAVLMSILGIYKVALTHKKLGITKELLASKVLPFLFPLCIDNNLNLSQFNSFVSVVKDMVQQVESEHRLKLEQLNAVQEEQRTLQKFAQQTISSNGTAKEPVANSNGLSAVFDGIDQSSVQQNAVTEKNKSSSWQANSVKQQNNRPMPVQLSMEEKQRLAREQEQQLRLKSQPSLVPSTATAPPKQSAPKDLTSTLIDNNLMNMQRPNPFRPMPTASPTVNWNSSMSATMPIQPVYGNTTGMSSTPGACGQLGTAPKSKPVDMSAFDSLLPAKQKMPMNMMASSSSQSNLVQQSGYPTGGAWLSPGPAQQPAVSKPTNNTLSSQDLADFLG